MTGLEILEKYPLSKKVIKDWFMKSMLESFKDESVPEEFKKFMMEQGIEDDKVAKLIDVNVRILFDVLDENEVFISIDVVNTNWNNKMELTFLYAINKHTTTKNDYIDRYHTRKEAEHAAVKAAFEILEKKLSPVEEVKPDEEIVKE